MRRAMIRPGDKVAIPADWHPAGELVVTVAAVDGDELRLVTGERVRSEDVREPSPPRSDWNNGPGWISTEALKRSVDLGLREAFEMVAAEDVREVTRG